MANGDRLRGRAWVCGDYTDTYKILPEKYWKGQTGKTKDEELGKHAMEGVDPGFAAEAISGKYSFITAGLNFGGGGKSLEYPIFAIKAAGIKAVLAESCSRYFYRNAINNGLLVMICKGISTKVKTGDELELNPSKGEIRNVTTGIKLQSDPMPEIALEILDAGGYIPYSKKEMG
jgi:3-isopropylmalate/(R)-2-methylmalate dehydratase small subunit